MVIHCLHDALVTHLGCTSEKSINREGVDDLQSILCKAFTFCKGHIAKPDVMRPD